MTGLLLLVLAELADTVSSVVDMATGRGLEANPFMPHDVPGFLFVKAAVVLGVIAGFLLARRIPRFQRDIDTVFAFQAGLLAVVAMHNIAL